MHDLRRLPQFYLLDTRPVKIAETPDGGMIVLAYDRRTGQLVPNLDLLHVIFGQTADVTRLSEEDFEREVERRRREREQGPR